MIVPLDTVIYNPKARGVWCRTPYPRHKEGCPNFPKCIQERPSFSDIAPIYRWYAVIHTFYLKFHSITMKKKHPEWTDRQCRNPLYWQGKVRKLLREEAEYFSFVSPGSIILDIPEACGVEVFETMALIGVHLEKTPDIVRKVMLVGVVR